LRLCSARNKTQMTFYLKGTKKGAKQLQNSISLLNGTHH
jgi:hypothetical protein